jgi:hypothetical protein
LRVTGLKAANGPGIEFLEYLAPRTAGAAAAYSCANDLWHWQTTLSTGDSAKAAHKL